MASSKFLNTVLLAILYANYASAASRRRIIGRGLEVETFHPESKFETFGSQGLTTSSSRAGDLRGSASAFVASRVGLDAGKVSYRSGYSQDKSAYAYLHQTHNDIPFANAVANVAYVDDKVVSFGNSFVDTSKIADSTPKVDLKDAIKAAEDAVEGTHNNFKPSIEYLVKPDGSVALTHVIQVQNEEKQTFYEVFVDAHDKSVLSVTDFVAQASYTVLPVTKEVLTEGQEKIADPADLAASPLGWHNDGTTNTTTTAGNNVVAYKGSQSATTAQSAADLVFDYPYDTAVAPASGKNIDAARVNAFYLINTVHDVTYRYGFTEKAFNFQTSNQGKGGSGNDRVLMSVQDSSGTNNANFATPPDGQSGTCRMYIWTLTTPNRDGSLENDIPIHEMTHGVSNRLTGGGTGRCLQTTEAGGMGEGWSDALADWFQAKADFKDFVMGQYVTNNPAGIRSHPYSTSATTNPLRYSSLKTLNEVHDIGEAWANLLHNVLATLIQKYGFSETARTNPDGKEGNVVFLHLFIDSLAIQPCNPTFQTARDAWIQADANRYSGANKCLLWGVFASKGLGPNAKDYVDDNAVPAECSGGSTTTTTSTGPTTTTSGTTTTTTPGETTTTKTTTTKTTSKPTTTTTKTTTTKTTKTTSKPTTTIGCPWWFPFCREGQGAEPTITARSVAGRVNM